MKTLRFPLFAFVGLALAGSLRAAPATTDSASAQVEVNYVNPDKFMDIKDAYMPTDKGQEAILDDLKTYLVERTSRRLAPGQHLTINVTDIDLAGQFEPWHADAQDIRFIKDIYPPRMNLNFKLTDADGKVLKEGERRLSDNTYTMNINTVGRSDPRFYDKQLIDDWVRREFPAQKKKR